MITPLTCCSRHQFNSAFLTVSTMCYADCGQTAQVRRRRPATPTCLTRIACMSMCSLWLALHHVIASQALALAVGAVPDASRAAVAAALAHDIQVRWRRARRAVG